MLADDLISLLETENGSVTGGTNLFAGMLPPSPGNCAALIEYEGEQLLSRQNDASQETERPRVQLIVRNESYAQARALCYSLFKTLARVNNRLVNGHWYQRIMPIQSPFMLDRDENDRTLFAVNFAVVKEME